MPFITEKLWISLVDKKTFLMSQEFKKVNFDQSFDGGTAFFENRWEQVPDITIGAYPNRLILYYGGRWHAPAFDHTYKERKTLSFFLRLAN